MTTEPRTTEGDLRERIAQEIESEHYRLGGEDERGRCNSCDSNWPCGAVDAARIVRGRKP